MIILLGSPNDEKVNLSSRAISKESDKEVLIRVVKEELTVQIVPDTIIVSAQLKLRPTENLKEQ